MKLSDLKDNSPIIKDFKDSLNKIFKKSDSVAIVELDKKKRVGGVSALPVNFILENGQKITAYIRTMLEVESQDSKGKKIPEKEFFDLFRVDLNGKELPLANRFSNDNKANYMKAIDELAKNTLMNQAKFDKQRAKDGAEVVKVAQKRTNTKKKASLKELKEQLATLETQIAQNESIRDELQQQVNGLDEQLKKS